MPWISHLCCVSVVRFIHSQTCHLSTVGCVESLVPRTFTAVFLHPPQHFMRLPVLRLQLWNEDESRECVGMRAYSRGLFSDVPSIVCVSCTVAGWGDRPLGSEHVECVDLHAKVRLLPLLSSSLCCQLSEAVYRKDRIIRFINCFLSTDNLSIYISALRS